MRRWIKIAICGLLVSLIVGLGWLVVYESRFKNQSSKEALKNLHEKLQLGDPQQRVLELYAQFQTHRTRFRKDVSARIWEIGMPFELGSGDWILYLEFDAAERLSAAVIRTSDGIFRRPPESPPDKGEFRLAIIQQTGS
jgi:hypothetical protein